MLPIHPEMERTFNMRFTSFAVISFLAASAAFAATRPETTTYIDGNLTGVAANTGGTLVFSDEKAMTFRTGLTNVPVPYADVTRAELGAVKENEHDVPLYKVWALHKRFSKTETQLLTVDFKNEEGAPKTMTLELSHEAASQVLATIQSKVPNGVAVSIGPAKPGQTAAVASKPKPAPESWWGDAYWKTTNNSDKWNKPVGTNAPENQ
jgi:hypothetical protein